MTTKSKAKSLLKPCLGGKLWPPRALKLRAMAKLRLADGRTIQETLTALDRQLAVEGGYAYLVRTEEDRRAYEATVRPLLLAKATCEQVVQELITEELKAGMIVALGHPGPNSPVVSVPPRHWLFLTMDYSSGSAAAPRHDLHYAGLHIAAKSDAEKALVRLAQRMAEEVASQEQVAFSHSPEYDEVIWKGERFLFRGKVQRAVVRALHDAALRGEPWQRGQQTLGDAGSDDRTMKVGNLFSKHPAWGKLIVSNKRGFYRIMTD